MYYIPCLIRDKDIKLTPEEVVRQLYIDKLINEYGYTKSRIQVEYSVHFGREVKRADIVIMDKIQTTAVYIIIEVKKPKFKDGKEQLKSYCRHRSDYGSVDQWLTDKLFSQKRSKLF